MLLYIVAMGWTLIVMGGIAYLFKVKKDFSFLNGYANRPDEEKQYLEESGYLDATGNLITQSFWIFLITFIGGFFSIPYVFAIGMAIFILHLMIGLVWIQRYEVPHKRKKMLWITGFLAAGTIIFIIVITGVGFVDNEIHVDRDTFEITGMYGVEWKLEDIERVELLDELPEILMRTNGFSMSGIRKGKFQLEEPYGNGLLFINREEGPYVAVFTDDEYLIMNRKDEGNTREIYTKLLEKMN